MALKLQTIKKRKDFLSVRGGYRVRTPLFALEARQRRADAPPTGPRFGFTVTKKIGNAVTRNRIRRRLKHAVKRLDVAQVLSGFDYVVVAFDGCGAAPFQTLSDEIASGVTTIANRYRSGAPPDPRRKRRQQPKKTS